MGLFKEITVDHYICGEPLESNIAIVAACNPSGRKALSHGSTSRQIDLGKEWASGHYQVNELPKTMASFKWEYGALDSSQEKDFVFRRIEMMTENIPTYMKHDLTELIVTSHEAIRTFAVDNILYGMKRNVQSKETEQSSNARAKSSVSLRDIQRVFSLFNFFMNEFPLGCNTHYEAIYLTIAVVYYFKLDKKSRGLFMEKIARCSSTRSISKDFLSVIEETMKKVADETFIPPGIAITTGLKENIFMTLVCSLSLTPLMMIGPPGCSKVCKKNYIFLFGYSCTHPFFSLIFFRLSL